MVNLTFRQQSLVRTPITEQWANADLCTGDLNPLDDYDKPGKRFMDLYSGVVHFDMPTPPRDGEKDEIAKWREGRKASLDESFQLASDSSKAMAVVSDASVPNLPLQAIAAWDVYSEGRVIAQDWRVGGLSTSTDVELSAMAGPFDPTRSLPLLIVPVL
jgi:hypothetical protein